MKEIKELILAIQILAVVAAVFRIGYILLINLHEEDKTVSNRKIKNILIVLILMETIGGFARLIKHYYL